MKNVGVKEQNTFLNNGCLKTDQTDKRPGDATVKIHTHAQVYQF